MEKSKHKMLERLQVDAKELNETSKMNQAAKQLKLLTI